jgi:hypothetical protein
MSPRRIDLEKHRMNQWFATQTTADELLSWNLTQSRMRSESEQQQLQTLAAKLKGCANKTDGALKK